MDIFVGNLSPQISENELQQMFEAYGHVASANIIKKSFSGKSRGFGVVEMTDDDEAKAAIASLHDKELNERTLIVTHRRVKPHRRLDIERRTGIDRRS